VREVARVMHEVAEALEYAHGRGVIHRDIKPGNVLLMGSHALVTDFGVSKAISAAMPTSGSTSAGMAIGTPAYMAPEQLAADPAADHRMDLYALGLLAYEMLTGKVPFKEDSPQKTMAAQLTRDPAPVETTREDIPAALAMLIRRLLAKMPEDRPARAADVVSALDDLSVTSGPTMAMRYAPRSRWRAIAAIAAGMVVVGAAGSWGQRSAGESAADADAAVAESQQAAAPAAALLTREDSMAIARAVRGEMAKRPTPAPTSRADTIAVAAIADSIRVSVQRGFLDSVLKHQQQNAGSPVVRMSGLSAETMEEIAAATAAAVNIATAVSAVESAPPRSGPRRVVVAPPRLARGRPDVDSIGVLLVEALRTNLDAHPRYRVVDADSVNAALRVSRTLDAVRELTRADIIVSISLIPARDSVVRLVQIREMEAHTPFNVRVISSTAPSNVPNFALDKLGPDALATLLDMERNARQWMARPPRPPRTPTTAPVDGTRPVAPPDRP
jgi:serine/threonine-protein kinase